MECKKCGKKLNKEEIYCDDCKLLLNKEKELDKLIDKNKELNKLEITKEVETLQNFKDEKKESEYSLKEELKDLVNIGELELDEKDNKVSAFVIGIIIGLIIIILLVCLLVFNKEKDEEPETITEEPNYTKIINDYGKSIELIVSNYVKENKEVPSWSIVSDLIEYKEHEVVCGVRNIYSDSSIYLSRCKVDGKRVENTYGEEKEELKEGKKIEIYKTELNEYTDKKSDTYELLGSITCKTEDCKYINAYEKYVLIEENKENYIYNYETSTMEFGPFNIEINYENNVLSYNNKLYGILYELNNQKNIYSLITEKTFKNVEGEMLEVSPNLNPTIMYKYGYIILKDENKNNFVNLKTGNISYSITGEINNFIENETNNLVYMTIYNKETSKIILYNSNGKKLFDGQEFNNVRIVSENIIVSTDSNFYIYDASLKLKLTSKDYNHILGLFDDFVVVVDEGYLEIVNTNDEILATFDLEWDKGLYTFDNILSGKKDNIIYLIIERSNSSLKYYYDTVTKEFGLK